MSPGACSHRPKPELPPEPSSREIPPHPPEPDLQPLFVRNLGEGTYGRVDLMQIPGKGFFARKIFKREDFAKKEYLNFYKIRFFPQHPNIIQYQVSFR